MDLARLHAVTVIGRGAKGVVFLIRFDSGEMLALKAISRDRIEKRGAVGDEAGTTHEADAYRRIWFERDVLMSLRHPLLPSFRGLVSTGKIVGFVMDWCPGGNLTALRCRQTEQTFSDELIRFYAAELVLALEYLHKQRIVYRDLKPENILIQDSGHIMLVDFDLSVKLPDGSPSDPSSPGPAPNKNPDPVTKRMHWRLFSCFSLNSGVSPEISDQARGSPEATVSGESGKSNSFVGTEEYVAPEVIRGCGHDYAVDWWSLGVVLYEMLYGRTPFRGQNRKETFYRILTKEAELVGEHTALRDLIRGLLEKDAEKRLRVEEIKRHEFFRGVDWVNVLTVARTPFIPAVVDWEAEEGILGREGLDVEKRVEEIFTVGKERKEAEADFCDF